MVNIIAPLREAVKAAEQVHDLGLIAAAHLTHNERSEPRWEALE